MHRKQNAFKEAKIAESKLDDFKDMRARYIEREDYNIITAQANSAGGSADGSAEEDNGNHSQPRT